MAYNWRFYETGRNDGGTNQKSGRRQSGGSNVKGEDEPVAYFCDKEAGKWADFSRRTSVELWPGSKMNDPFFGKDQNGDQGRISTSGILKSGAVTTDRTHQLPGKRDFFPNFIGWEIFRAMPVFLQGRRNTAPSLNTTR